MLGKGVGNTELLMVKWVFPAGGSNFLKASRKMIFSCSVPHWCDTTVYNWSCNKYKVKCHIPCSSTLNIERSH